MMMNEWTWGTNLKPCNISPIFRFELVTCRFISIYCYVIGVVLKAFGINNICLQSFENFDVYVDREWVVTK